MFSFYQLLEELDKRVKLEEAVWKKLLRPTNPHLSSWKEKLSAAIGHRKAFMKSKNPFDQQQYKKAFQSAQHSKQKARDVLSRFKTQVQPASEQEEFCGNGKVCRKWDDKDNSCVPGCQQAGISEGGTCVYFNDENNEQENCPCFVLKKDEADV